MTKVLIPIDGSEFSDRAVSYLVEQCTTGGAPDVHLLNVQIPIESGHARMFATPEEIEAYHRDEGMKVLKPAMDRLDTENIPYSYHVLVGHTSQTIARYAEEEKFDKVIMGTHGRSGLTHLLLGSVSQNVLRHVKIPVALVK
ncbi:MAG: universal stress protein [Pseudomonadota bacterium]|nr:universal stress protein [Pseudomonadota bacterium]